MRKLKELWLKHGVTAFIGTLFLLTFCAGCNASTSNASTRSIPVSMGFTASSDASTTTSSGDTMGEENQTGVTPSALQLTAAWTNVEKIEFEFTEPQQEDQMEESGNNEITAEGPFMIDLMAGQATPHIMQIDFPAGSMLKQVEARLTPAAADATLPSDAPPALAGHSLVLNGTVDVGGTATPFSIQLTSKVKAEFENEAGFAASNSTELSQILLAMKLDPLFAGVDLGACVTGGGLTPENGVFVIDEETAQGPCAEVTETIKANIKEAGEVQEQQEES